VVQKFLCFSLILVGQSLEPEVSPKHYYEAHSKSTAACLIAGSVL